MNSLHTPELIPFGATLTIEVPTAAIGTVACVMDTESKNIDDVNVPPPGFGIPVLPPDLFPPKVDPESPVELPDQETSQPDPQPEQKPEPGPDVN